MLRFSPRVATACVSLLFGCSHDPPRSTPVQNPCAAIDEANRALLARASSTDAGGASADFYRDLRAATVCKEARHGAWAIELSSLKTEAGEMSARWSLVHVSPSGKRASVSPALTGTLTPGPTREDEPNLLWTDYRRTLPTAPVLFDYDGSGTASPMSGTGFRPLTALAAPEALASRSRCRARRETPADVVGRIVVAGRRGMSWLHQ